MAVNPDTQSICCGRERRTLIPESKAKLEFGQNPDFAVFESQLPAAGRRHYPDARTRHNEAVDRPVGEVLVGRDDALAAVAGL